MLNRTRIFGNRLGLLSVLALAASLAAVGCLRESPTVPQNAALLGKQGANLQTTGVPGSRPASPDAVSTPQGPQLAISPVVTETGQVSLSLDAAGTNDPVTTIQVETPARWRPPSARRISWRRAPGSPVTRFPTETSRSTAPV